MKITTIFGVAFLAVLTFGTAHADTTLEERVSKLESKALSLPDGMFINGNIEAYYDDKTYDSGWDGRSEFIFGIQNDMPENPLGVDWAGGSMRLDSHYSLDTTKNNELVEKQIGFGNDTARFFVGETDAQRLGFSKTPKISVPLIYTQSNYRIDHNEKTVLAFGGWDWEKNNEMDFDTYGLSRETPWGVSIGRDTNQDTWYGTATVSLMGYADVSYMTIRSPESASGYSKKTNQEGFAIGGSLHRFGAPVIWGIEKWDDKDTGTYTEADRMDYGLMYMINENFSAAVHKMENDDLGNSGMYYGLIYDVAMNNGQNFEAGVYLHDTEQTNIFTGAHTDNDQKVIGSIKLKF